MLLLFRPMSSGHGNSHTAFHTCFVGDDDLLIMADQCAGCFAVPSDWCLLARAGT